MVKLVVVEAQDGHKGFLGDRDLPDRFEPFFARFLLAMIFTAQANALHAG